MMTLGQPRYHEHAGEWWRQREFRADHAPVAAKTGDRLFQDANGYTVYVPETDQSWPVAAALVLPIVLEAELAGLTSPRPE